MTPSRGIEPGPHWWEASAHTTAPSLHPIIRHATQGMLVSVIRSGFGDSTDRGSFEARVIFRHRILQPGGLNVDFGFIALLRSTVSLNFHVFVLHSCFHIVFFSISPFANVYDFSVGNTPEGIQRGA